MKLDDILNKDRVNAMSCDVNAYARYSTQTKQEKVRTQQMSKVIFPQPYENASRYYNKTELKSPPLSEPPKPNPQQSQNNFQPMFDIKSLLPMLMSGKLDILKPLMSMFGGGNAGGGLGDMAKIFELFKPKSKTKKEEKVEDVSSKFDDMIIIED